MVFSTPVNKLVFSKLICCILIWAGVSLDALAQTTTHWTGTYDAEWNDVRNWDGGLPDITKHVVIGEKAFTNAPVINVDNQGANSQSKCYSLTIGGNFPATLTFYNRMGLHIETNLTIKTNGTLYNKRTKITIKGDWKNDGFYEEEAIGQGNKWTFIPTTEFIGTSQKISGTKTTKFNHLEIKSYVTLENNLLIDLTDYNYGNLIVHPGAVIDPGNYKINWDNTKANRAFQLMNGATAKVKALNYLDNYGIYPTPAYGGTTIDHTSTIDYAGTIDQNIDNQIVYQKLVISGTGVKYLTGTTTVSSGATDTQVNVNSATLDLGTYTLTRQAAGGSFTVASGATVKIGGLANTPVDFTTRTFDPNSTVEYYGTNQTVQHNTYGHLLLSNAGIKSMPNTSMTVAGNLTSTGTVQYAAASALTVGGNLTIGVGTTFTGANFIHNVAGNWLNNGTFISGSGTIILNGTTNTSITGATTFNGLTINKTAATNYVTLNNSITAATLGMTNGDLHTGAEKVTVTSSRTGNGWIVGTITRQHAFASGTAYEFNGPYTTLTFTTPVGVNNVTMISGAATFLPTGFTTGKSINRLYEVQLAAGTFTNASLQLQYKDAELNGCEEDGLKLYFAPTSAGAWSNASRHAYDATQNWVRRNNLASINGFWTLTDNPSTYKWDGTTSIAWENGANWEVWTDGPPTRGVTGPITSDFVELGSLVPSRQPTITTAEWVRDIRFFGNNQIALNVTAGSLRTTANLATSGAGTNIQHTLTAGAQPITIGGNLVLNDGSTGNSLSLSSTSGTITIAGGIQHHQTGSITLNTGNLNIGGDYIYTAGNFAGGTSTVTYNGTAGQTVGAVPYHHLTINKTGGTATYAATGTQNITGNLTINNAGVLAVTIPLLNVAGNVSITAGTLQANTSTIDLKGNWSTANTSSFVPGTSTVIFSGTGAQLVTATNFNNLSKTAAGTLTTTGNSTINGDLSVQAGTLVLNSHLMNRNSTGGTLTVANGATLRVNNTSVFPTNFNTYTLGTTSNVIYSAGAGPIEGITYGNLTIQDISTRPLKGNTRVANQMSISSNSTLNDATFSLILDNNLANNGIINAPNTSLVFTGATAQLNGTGTGGTTIKDITVNAGAGLTVSKDLNVHGNITNNGTGFSAAANFVNLTGTTAATITSGVPVTIHQLRVNKTGTTPTVTLAADINGLLSINVATGTLNAANRTLTETASGTSSLTVANNATMRVAGDKSLPLFDGYTLGTTSTVVYEGSNQSIKSVQYGNLSLQNWGTATFEAGTARIARDFLKGTESNVVTPETIEFNGAVAQAVPGVSYRNLRFSAAGNKLLAGNASVSEKLTLTAGMVLTNSFGITLGPTATLEGESETSYVLGTIKTTRTVNATRTDFGGIGIAITPALEAGLSTMTRVTGVSVGKDNNSIKRYYHFQPSLNTTKLNATIEATYLDADLTPNHLEPQLQLYTARTLSDGWTALSEPNPGRIGQTITATGVNSINFLTFSTSVMPLPVELVYFKATKVNNNAVLEWRTASEENNKGFEVQVSADGYTYQAIGFVKSTVGTSVIAQTYAYTDTRNGKNGVVYYRLRQVDVDGTFKYYGPKTINFGTVTKTSIKAFPNPFTSGVKLAIDAETDGKATVTLYATSGKVLLHLQEQLAKGSSELQLNLDKNLPTGLYLLTIEQSGKKETLKLIKH
ncbi:T9SS type A sorting domain-containing protein [Pontibacter sp. H259]|uniref:T9SS type A sorting domain-containing protein n=1 Tax=Pontibacter sp. H259 TaxID=3133421 RepID=UPI0030C492A2